MLAVSLVACLAFLAWSPAAGAAMASAPRPADLRLEEAFTLLSPLQDRDGIAYADALEVRRVAIIVGDLPSGLLAVYFEPRRLVVIAPSTLDEQQPTMVASIMAHELQHAADRDLNREGSAQFDCLERESRGFETQVKVWRTFWPDALPTGTRAEQDLAVFVPAYERRGIDGIREIIARTPGYTRLCGDDAAPERRPFQPAP